MDDLVVEIEALKKRMTDWEDWSADLADVLRHRTEELRQAADRLDAAERRYSQFAERHEVLERFAAEQLGADVADLRRAMRGIGLVASAIEPRAVQVN